MFSASREEIIGIGPADPGEKANLKRLFTFL
jgi:hypothetical protein